MRRPLVLTFTQQRQKSGRFFQIFVAFSENLCFNVKIIKMYMIFVTEFVFLGKNLHTYEVRINSFPHGRISEIFFLDHFSPSFLGQKITMILHNWMFMKYAQPHFAFQSLHVALENSKNHLGFDPICTDRPWGHGWLN